jgi:DegV family protein with EDD domain
MPTDARPICIVTDSAADIPPDIAQQLNITVVPLLVTFGSETFADRELPPDEFWHRAHGPVPPQTSQPPTGAFLMAFERLLAQGYEVICLTLTGEHSGTYSSAWSAAQHCAERVTVLDSRFLSIATGWQVLRAAELAQRGALREEILVALSSLRDRTRLFIQLETLEFIRRGGRAARLLPTIDRIARALSIRPILNMPDGQLRLMGAARSTAKGIARLAAELAALGPLEMAQVMHIRAEEQAGVLAREVAARTRLALEQIGIGEAGAALACHGGEGVLGVAALLAG